MKVILNDDVKHLGEMGDTKNVANGSVPSPVCTHSLSYFNNFAKIRQFLDMTKKNFPFSVALLATHSM